VAENYKSAALRHFDDATTLRTAGRVDNAGHLIGFAAECAIKHRIVSMHPEINAPHLHFPELLSVAKKQLGPRSKYTSMYDVLKPAVFMGWHVNHRYDETGSTSETDLSRWFIDTTKLFKAAEIKVKK
jgi:HEPN domain-containing protein